MGADWSHGPYGDDEPEVAKQRLILKPTAMSITVSNDLLEKVHITQEELVTDFACYLYDKERLSFGKCRQLCGMNHLDFQRALASRNIYIKYDEDDLAIDLKNLGITL